MPINPYEPPKGKEPAKGSFGKSFMGIVGVTLLAVGGYWAAYFGRAVQVFEFPEAPDLQTRWYATELEARIFFPAAIVHGFVTGKFVETVEQPDL